MLATATLESLEDFLHSRMQHFFLFFPAPREGSSLLPRCSTFRSWQELSEIRRVVNVARRDGSVRLKLDELFWTEVYFLKIKILTVSRERVWIA
jgi:hypothetical protein